MKKIFFFLLAVAQILFFTSCEKDPIGCFSMSSDKVKVGESVTLTDCSTKAKHQWFDKGTPSIYTWDFGDGNTGSGASVSHTYSSAGKFTVTLQVQDEDKDHSATVTQSITVTQPSDISRSGKFIAFTSNKDGKYDIWLAQVDGSGALATTNLVYANNPYNLTTSFSSSTANIQPNWSPDGRILLFSAQLSATDEEVFAFFFNSDGSLVNTTPIIAMTQANSWNENAFFSPDGNKVIFDRRVDQNGDGIDLADNRDIFMAWVHTTSSTITVDSISQLTSTGNIDEYNAKWSPVIAVQRIAYERPPTPTANDHDIYVMDPLNTTTNNIDWNNPGSSGYPAWSPDCSFMAFETNSGNGGFWKIVKANYPSNSGTTDIAKIAGQDYRYPTVLPNGTLVAYIQQTSTTKGNIYVVPVSGGSSTKLLPATFDNFDNKWPAW